LTYGLGFEIGPTPAGIHFAPARLSVALFGISAGTLLGTVVGAMQRLILRQWLSHLNWWVLGTAASWGIGLGIVELLGWRPIEDLFLLLTVLLFGAIIGLPDGVGMNWGIAGGFLMATAQWLILRQAFRRAGWWIVVSSVGSIVSWAIALPFGLRMTLILGQVLGLLALLASPLLIGAIIGILFGTITGLPLVLILRVPRQGI